jgi:DNA-directed RNA polymerase specialized sigma24 family protein
MTLDEQKDIELLSRYYSGESDAGKELYLRINPELVKFLAARQSSSIGISKRKHNAENAAHDAWVVLFDPKNKKKFSKNKGAVKNLMFGIGKRCMSSEYIRGRKNNESIHDTIETPIKRSSTNIEDTILIEHLLSALDGKYSKHKDILLRKLEDKSTSQIAEEYGISTEAAKSRSRRAFDQARAILGDSENE